MNVKISRKWSSGSVDIVRRKYVLEDLGVSDYSYQLVTESGALLSLDASDLKALYLLIGDADDAGWLK